MPVLRHAMIATLLHKDCEGTENQRLGVTCVVAP